MFFSLLILQIHYNYVTLFNYVTFVLTNFAFTHVGNLPVETVDNFVNKFLFYIVFKVLEGWASMQNELNDLLTNAKELLKEEVLDELFEDLYLKEDEGFLKLLEIYTSYKDDEPLKDIVKSIYNFR